MAEGFLRHVFADDAALGEYIARDVRALIAKKPDALLSIAAGTSSIPAFQALLSMVRSGAIDFSRARFIAMDEWLGIPTHFEGSMYGFLTDHFLSAAGFADAFLFDGMADAGAEVARAEHFLNGRPIDYILFGIGMNGHIALNEPGCREDARIRAVDVAPTTAKVGQKYFGPGGAVLSRGITIGIANAMEAGRVALTANSREKRGIVRSIEQSPPTAELPATLLKRRGDVELLLTQASAT